MADNWDSDLTTPWAGVSRGITIAHPVFLPMSGSPLVLDNVLQQVNSIQGDGIPRVASIARYGLSLGDGLGNPVRMKLITAIIPVLVGTPGTVVTFQVGGEKGQPGVSQDSDFVSDYIIGETKKLDCLVTCKYAFYRMFTDSLNPVTLQAMGFEFEDIGSD